MSQLVHCWLPRRECFDFIRKHHRTHKPPPGAMSSLGAYLNGKLVGVATLGRPPRMVNDRETVCVTRVATDGTRNACSFLYGHAKRLAHAMGFRCVRTETDPDEGGASLRAVGARELGETRGESWDRPSRPRTDDHPVGPKTVWNL